MANPLKVFAILSAAERGRRRRSARFTPEGLEPRLSPSTVVAAVESYPEDPFPLPPLPGPPQQPPTGPVGPA